MKILITTDTYSPCVNGVVTSIVNLKCQLETAGHDVKILALSQDHHSHSDGTVYSVASYDCKIYPNTRISFKIRDSLISELIEWSPDIIHSQSEFSSYSFAKKISRRCNAPIIHTYHTLYEDYTHYFAPSKRIGKTIISNLSRIRLRNCRTVIAPTEKVYGTLFSYGLKNHMEIIPSGIDLVRLRTPFDGASKAALREKLGISQDKKVLVSLGRLALEKNIDELIDHMRVIGNMRDDIILLIVGDGPHRHALEEHAKEYNLQSCIIFAGMVPPADVYKYYSIADAFICASTSETQGLTYIEALSCGLPVICRADPCLDGIVKDGFNGFEYNDCEEFCSSVFKVIDNAELSKYMSQNAKLLSEEFSNEKFAAKVYALYCSELKENAMQNARGASSMHRIINRLRIGINS